MSDDNGEMQSYGDYFWCSGYVKYSGVEENNEKDNVIYTTSFIRKWNKKENLWHIFDDEDFNYES